MTTFSIRIPARSSFRGPVIRLLAQDESPHDSHCAVASPERIECDDQVGKQGNAIRPRKAVRFFRDETH